MTNRRQRVTSGKLNVADERDAWLDHSYLIVARPHDSSPEVTCWRWTGDPSRRIQERIKMGV